MKRIARILVLGALLYAGWMLFLNSRVSSKENGADVVLLSADDSLSYAVSMLVAEDMPSIMADSGVDSTTIDDFVRGMRAAFPLDDTPESRAYMNGVMAAVEASDMIEKANSAIYPDEKEKSVDRRLFLEGLVAMATGGDGVMPVEYAIDYYNQHVFRARSEQFIRENAVRPGVVTLPSGVQYKVGRMGDGKRAEYTGTVKCIYKGMYPNGAVFDSSRGEAAVLAVNEMAPGLAEALMTLPAGTQCMVYVPWNLAYGKSTKDKIAPYSALVYDIEILETE